MFNIFKSGSLQMKEDEAWSQVGIADIEDWYPRIFTLLVIYTS